MVREKREREEKVSNNDRYMYEIWERKGEREREREIGKSNNNTHRTIQMKAKPIKES